MFVGGLLHDIGKCRAYVAHKKVFNNPADFPIDLFTLLHRYDHCRSELDQRSIRRQPVPADIGKYEKKSSVRQLDEIEIVTGENRAVSPLKTDTHIKLPVIEVPEKIFIVLCVMSNS